MCKHFRPVWVRCSKYLLLLLLYICAGREWSDWSQELRVPGEELRWKFTSDGSVNGWGWLFTVYPIMPAAAPLDMLSDRTILSRPSIDLVTCLLDFKLENTMDRGIIPRLAASLAACAQLSCLSESSCSSVQFSSVQLRMASVHSEKPIIMR